MKRLATLLLLLTFGLANGQKQLAVGNYSASDVFFETTKPVIKVTNIAEADIPQVLQSEANYPSDISFVLFHKIESKALTHYHYYLYKNGFRVFGAQAHVGIDKNKKVRICELPILPALNGSQEFPVAGTDENVKNYVGAENITKAEQVWFTDGGDYLKKGLLVTLHGPETLHQEVLVSGNEIISQADLHKYLHGPNDSIVSVRVFTPDPVSSAQVAYAAPYNDNGDQTNAQLEAEQKTKSLVVAYESGAYQAKNDHVEILDFSAPNIAPVSSATKQMHFTRDQSGFEDMNVMYHITTQKEHMISLGYPNIPDYKIQVDPHAINGADQSFFSTASVPGKLYFGEGGVDDAEDADVIIHEYMHSVMYVAAPSSTTSTERGCIEEAIGDYFAASYSRTINTYNDGWVFNWDGHNEFWPGRDVYSTKDYGQESFKNNNIYSHTDLFASPLMEINMKLGRNTADALVLEAIFSLTQNTTMPQMAGYIILSDSLLNNGVNYQIIYDAFVRRNIIPTISLGEYASAKDLIQVYNTIGFSIGEPLMIRSNDLNISSYAFTSINGQQVKQGTLSSQRGEVIELAAPDLKSGVYLLTLFTSEGTKATYKLTRSN